MGISTYTALEIFTNPSDLEITIGRENEGEKYAFGIYRGRGHNFKPLLTSQAFAETKEDAIKGVEETLLIVLEANHHNPDGQDIDQSKVLNQDLIARILEELRRNDKVSTCKMLDPAS